MQICCNVILIILILIYYNVINHISCYNNDIIDIQINVLAKWMIAMFKVASLKTLSSIIFAILIEEQLKQKWIKDR